MVGVFRADAARAGASEAVKALVDELSGLSPEFAAMWRDNDVRSYGEGTKQLHHPVAGCSRWNSPPCPWKAGRTSAS
ncbi:MAG: hypothetical protein WDM84_08340 [Bauldia sp.]